MNAPNFTHLCDRCGCPLEATELRYIVRLEVFAAPTPLKISEEELRSDPQPEIARLLKQCEGMSEEELMRDVHVEMKFDLCRRCQQAYLRNPLPPIDR